RADRLDVRTASGDVTVDTVQRSSLVQTASGDIRVGQVEADAEFRTASGDVLVGRSQGSVSVHSTSGDVRLAEPLGDVFVRNVSGAVDVESFAQGALEATSVSGAVTVGLLPGALAKIDLRTVSGPVRNDFQVQDEEPPRDPESDRRVALTCRTTSGGIRLRRAVASTRTPTATNAWVKS
ncbi:MAG: DUF4097 family beta strand repeat protein, partial [Williamsia herbipolensis]|nr:DUF4097 family beta strand repeat protein [Williamsia herbipolensis]